MVGDFYGVALIVEDFTHHSLHTPLSQVSLQFLVEIIDTPSCLSKPTVSSNLSGNTRVQVGNQFQFTVIIQAGCSSKTIREFFRVSPLFMYKSNLTQYGSANKSMVIETWIPTMEQIGSQMYCATAIDK